MEAEEEQITTTSYEEIALENITTSNNLKRYVLNQGEKLIDEAIALGGALYAEVADLEKLGKDDPLQSKLIRSHVIGHYSKQLALLYRDILFETQKAELIVQEGSASELKLNDLLNHTKETILKAQEEFQNFLTDRKLEAWDATLLVKQNHPWPIYESQLLEIKDHLAKLSKKEVQLSELSSQIIALKKIISDNLEEVNNRFEDIIAQSEKILRADENSTIEEVMNLLQGTNQALDHNGVITMAHSQIEKSIKDSSVNMSPIIDIEGGIMIEEDLSPQYQLEQWYDIEILPLLEDAVQQLDTMTYNLRLSLINIINRLELVANKSKEFSFEDYRQPLLTYMESVPAFRNAIDTAIMQAREKIEKNLTLKPLLSGDEPFLSSGFQQSINRFKKEQNLLLERITYFWNAIKNKYFSIRSTVREESKLGDVEKVIRFIKGASSDRNNIHYNNFFNAKVTMVEAFWMNRDLEQKRINQVFKSWNDGFSGAILLYGDRYSGKTSLGDWLSQQYFRGKTYQLKPGQSMVIAGTKVDLGHDLIAGIKSFIDRVQYARPLIWIDDLELWFNESQFSDEVGLSLTHLINNYGKRVFFVVSVGSWTYKRLNQFIDLNHTFQSTIELSPFSNDVLKEALLLRHGASHKALIGADGQKVSKIEFDRYVNQIARQSGGNIGYSLQLWINNVRYKDDHHVEIKEVMNYKFPDIITNDNGIILSSLLIYRRLKEEDLQNLIGPSYSQRYQTEVVRLIGFGIIRRSYNGVLSINDKVVPAITEGLRKNRFV